MLKKLIILFIILMIALSTIAYADDGENILNNSDFEGDITEDSLPDGWFTEMWHTTEGFTSISIEDINGNKAIKIESNEANDARIAQNVKVKGNKTYKLAGWIYSDGISEGQGANLSFEDIMDTSEGVYNSNGEWQYVELYGRTSWFQSYVKVFVRVGGYGALSQGTAYFDDIVLEEVKDVPDGAKVISLKKPKAQKVETEEDANKFKFLGPSFLITFLTLIIFLMIKKRLFDRELEDKYINKKTILGLVLILGLGIRIVLSVSIRGYPNDISCWLGWSDACYQYNLFNVYQNVSFLDYPPGYMYVLYILGFYMSLLKNVFGPILENIQWLIVKIPSITADVIVSFIIFKAAKGKIGEGKALLLMGIYFLNPAVILNSAAWGQIDGILALFAVLYVVALYKRKFYLAGIYLAIGVLMKIQMVMFVPLYLTAMWAAGWEYFKEKRYWQYARDVFAGILAGLATLFLFGMLPFFIIGEGKEAIGFIELYSGSLDTYDRLSLNATNFWTLIGGNWVKIEEFVKGIEVDKFTNITIAIPIIIFLVFGFIDRKKDHIFMHAALLITGMFMLTVKMHERYMFPALALLLMSAIYTKRRSSYLLFLLFTIAQFLNTALVLANEYVTGIRNWMFVLTGAEAMTSEKFIVTLISLLALISYGYMIYVCINMARKKKETLMLATGEGKLGLMSLKRKENTSSKKKLTIESEEGFFKKLSRMDAIIMVALTIGYSLIAFINLGSLVGPETNFKTVTSNSEVIVDFGEQKNISELWFFRGKSSSNSSFYVSYSNELDGEYETLNYIRITYGGMFDDNTDELEEREKIKRDFGIDGEVHEQIFFSNYPDVFKWFSQTSKVTARYAKITFEKSALYMFEVGFKDPNGEVVPISELIYDVSNEDMPYDRLFDEQETIPEEITHMNSTYFDEIYHAGTAWEHINYVEPYETTHPPLGKVMMSWGIKLFGMNTFGWRFMGTLMGVLMVPAMYLLAKLLLKKKRYAFIAAFLMTFDFMHFVQTRIATIDSYSVLFIMLMYLFMGIYYKMSYNKTPLIKTLIPLGLSGIFFGLGAASKWICIYAGIGLAVLFFISFFKRRKEYMYVINNGAGIDKNQAEKIKSEYLGNTIITLVWCVIFFIIVPALIYYASYIPILKIDASKDFYYVINNQKNMFNYHSGLNSTHSFASKWYEWPFIIKPMWFYSNDIVRGTGYMGSIATFGNPAVWWIGALAMIYLAIDTYLQKKMPKEAIFILIAFLSQFLPWVNIERSTFIYHYFASVPFIILATVYAIKVFEERYKMKEFIKYVYAGIVLLLFILFYPVLTGTIIPSWYGQLLKWMPTWWFLY